MSLAPCDFRGRADGMIFADDFIAMPLQCATQWDGLAHAGYDGMFYNGVPAETVTPGRGSTLLSIDKIAARGVAGRGVLLDVRGRGASTAWRPARRSPPRISTRPPAAREPRSSPATW